MSTLRTYQVDAFSALPFSGNPAAVCVVPNGQTLEDEQLQLIAAEMNLSETAFVFSPSTDFVAQQTFKLRWFTPTREVDLCGHATLASAAALYLKENNACDQIHFETLSGILKVKKQANGFQLDFPMNPPVPTDAGRFQKVVDMILHALGVSELVEAALSERTKKLVLLVDCDRSTLEKMSINTSDLQAAHSDDIIRGVIVTCRAPASSSYDFLSRYFAPWNGIPEDPVTGSAHTVLYPYWRAKLSKDTLSARQCSKRGGDLVLSPAAEESRVCITGQAKVVLEGQLCYK